MAGDGDVSRALAARLRGCLSRKSPRCRYGSHMIAWFVSLCHCVIVSTVDSLLCCYDIATLQLEEAIEAEKDKGQENGLLGTGTFSFSPKGRPEAQSDTHVPLSMVFAGVPPIRKYHCMPDTRHVLTLNSRKQVFLWDLVLGMLVKVYGCVSWKDMVEAAESNAAQQGAKRWFTIDHHLGCLSILLRERTALLGQAIMPPVASSVSKIPTRVNLGETALRHVLREWLWLESVRQALGMEFSGTKTSSQTVNNMDLDAMATQFSILRGKAKGNGSVSEAAGGSKEERVLGVLGGDAEEALVIVSPASVTAVLAAITSPEVPFTPSAGTAAALVAAIDDGGAFCLDGGSVSRKSGSKGNSASARKSGNSSANGTAATDTTDQSQPISIILITTSSHSCNNLPFVMPVPLPDRVLKMLQISEIYEGLAEELVERKAKIYRSILPPWVKQALTQSVERDNRGVAVVTKTWDPDRMDRDMEEERAIQEVSSGVIQMGQPAKNSPTQGLGERASADLK